jgi:hypothetical protein
MLGAAFARVAFDPIAVCANEVLLGGEGRIGLRQGGAVRPVFPGSDPGTCSKLRCTFETTVPKLPHIFETSLSGNKRLSSRLGGDSSVGERDLDAGAAEVDHRDQRVGGVESVSAGGEQPDLAV